MHFLRTNTATRVTVGPFLDVADGVTPMTGLTVTSDHLTLICDVAGAPTLVLDANATASGGNNDMVHVAGDDAGFYDLEITAAQINYVGRARLAIMNPATHLPVFHEYHIIPAALYDAMVLGLNGGLPTGDFLLALIQLALRADAAIATDRAAVLAQINANQGSGAGTYNNTVDGTVNVTHIEGADATDAIDARVTAMLSAYGVATAAAVTNIQNNTWIGTNIPQLLERPDSGSVTVQLVVTVSDETGSPKNIDASGLPTVTLVNNAGTDLSSRLGSWTNPATGKYVAIYTNTSTDAIDDLHWEVTGTVNTKLRRWVGITQIVDTTAIDFTSTDRTNLSAIAAKLPAGTMTSPGDAMTLTGAYDLYTAEINVAVDAANSRDEYTLQWFRNGIAQIAANVSSPTIQVVKRADGTDLIAQTALTAIGATGYYKRDEAVNRLTPGEAVVVVAVATINGSPRTFKRIISRDSA